MAALYRRDPRSSDFGWQSASDVKRSNMTDERAEDQSYENEGMNRSMVTISLKEYDRLREKQKYITDRDLIGCIDKIEELVRALRKHIVRSDFE